MSGDHCPLSKVRQGQYNFILDAIWIFIVKNKLRSNDKKQLNAVHIESFYLQSDSVNSRALRSGIAILFAVT